MTPPITITDFTADYPLFTFGCHAPRFGDTVEGAIDPITLYFGSSCWFTALKLPHIADPPGSTDGITGTTPNGQWQWTVPPAPSWTAWTAPAFVQSPVPEAFWFPQQFFSIVPVRVKDAVYADVVTWLHDATVMGSLSAVGDMAAHFGSDVIVGSGATGNHDHYSGPGTWNNPATDTLVNGSNDLPASPFNDYPWLFFIVQAIAGGCDLYHGFSYAADTALAAPPPTPIAIKHFYVISPTPASTIAAGDHTTGIAPV